MRSGSPSSSSEANRIQKLLEAANVKLAAVATDSLGASGRAMLAALAAGETEAATLWRRWPKGASSRSSRRSWPP